MNILIVEDEFLIANMIQIMLKRNGYRNISHADTVEKAVEALGNLPDICLLDIRLHDACGIDFARILQERNILFIFITANNELATIKAAAKTNPQAYLSKPINEKDLIAALEIINSKFSNYLWLKSKEGKVKINQSDILFIEADNVYSKIICETKTYTERITLKEIELLLNPEFVKVHRSYIVNKTKIDSFKSGELKIGNYTIPISRKTLNLELI